MRNFFISSVLLAFAGSAAYSQSDPTWSSPVALGSPFVYYNGTGIPYPQSSSGAYPLNLYFPTSQTSSTGVADVYGCTWNNYEGQATTSSFGSGSNAYPPPYPSWYLGYPNGGTHESGTIYRQNLAQVGAGYQASAGSVYGFSVQAQFPEGTTDLGINPASAPGAAFFWESDNCADGDTEYGWTIGQTSNNGTIQPVTTFYYSYWTNCYANSSYTCWSAVYAPSVGMFVESQVTQCTGGVTFPTLTGSSDPNGYTYNSFPYQDPGSGNWFFRAEVMDGTNLVEGCNIDPTGTNTSCSPQSLGQLVNTNASGGQCAGGPSLSTTQFNTSSYFNPQWVSGVGGWVFAVLTGQYSSAYLPGGSQAQFTVNSIRIATN